jgi:hypothetical protein
LGAQAAIDTSDGAGMNMMDLKVCHHRTLISPVIRNLCFTIVAVVLSPFKSRLLF